MIKKKSGINGIKELIKHRYIQRYRVYDIETGKVHHWEALVLEDKFDEESFIASVKERYLKMKMEK